MDGTDNMPERYSYNEMNALFPLYLVNGNARIAQPNLRYLKDGCPSYQWDDRRSCWCKVPHSGGLMGPIVEAANGTR